MEIVRRNRGRLRYLMWRLRRRRRKRRNARSGAPVRQPSAPPTRWHDKDAPSSALLIAFGGLDSAFGMPPFEFLRVTEETQAKRLFVRDLHGAWYHRGFSGGGIEEVRDFLAREIEACGAERVVMVGSSAGGYAALLFGSLLRADVVLSFSPQSTIDLDELHRLGDRRWDDDLGPLTRQGVLQPQWMDLRTVLAQYNGLTRYRLFVDETFDVDRRHVDRLAGAQHLRIYRFGHGSHRLVNKLRQKGVLTRILDEALTPPVSQP